MFIFICIALCGNNFDDVYSLGVPDKTEVDDDQNNKDDDQNVAMAADKVRIHLNDTFHFNSEMTSEKKVLESRLFNISVFNIILIA